MDCQDQWPLPDRERPLRTWPALSLTGADLDDPADLIAAALLDLDVAAIEDTYNQRRVYFTSAAARDAAADRLRVEFPHLSLSPIDVPDDGWAARSQASLRAVTVGALVIAPPWDAMAGRAHQPRATGDVSSQVIVIQPSMGFGTGHHATTRLCLAALQQLDLRGRTVIDVGTGSGVLAIAAGRRGATAVTGIDDDPDALQAAGENVALNPGANVALHVEDLRTVTLPPADLVLANLTGGLLVTAAPILQALTRPHGWLILSGFMADEEVAVRQAFAGCTDERRDQEDEWVCVTLRHDRIAA